MAEMPAVSDCWLPQRVRILALRYAAVTRFHSQRLLNACNELFAAHGKALGPTPTSPLEATR